MLTKIHLGVHLFSVRKDANHISSQFDFVET